jgi:hypothetical protein
MCVEPAAIFFDNTGYHLAFTIHIKRPFHTYYDIVGGA